MPHNQFNALNPDLAVKTSYSPALLTLKLSCYPYRCQWSPEITLYILKDTLVKVIVRRANSTGFKKTIHANWIFFFYSSKTKCQDLTKTGKCFKMENWEIYLKIYWWKKKWKPKWAEAGNNQRLTIFAYSHISSINLNLGEHFS